MPESGTGDKPMWVHTSVYAVTAVFTVPQELGASHCERRKLMPSFIAGHCWRCAGVAASGGNEAAGTTWSGFIGRQLQEHHCPVVVGTDNSVALAHAVEAHLWRHARQLRYRKIIEMALHD